MLSKKILKTLTMIGAGIGGGLIGYGTYLYFKQDSMIFDVQKLSKQKLAEIEIRYPDSNFFFESPTGITLQGFELHKDKDLPMVIFFGGNCDEASFYLDLFDQMEDYHIVLPNYPGYGLSGGVPSESSFYTEALSIYDHFAQKYNKEPKDIFIIGRSIGTCVVTYLASQRETNSICLITPFHSLEELAQRMYPFLPVSWLIKHRFNAIEFAPKVTAPCLFILAEYDKSVPKQSSEKLAKAWGGEVKLITLPDTTHEDIMEYPVLLDEITEFFESYLKK